MTPQEAKNRIGTDGITCILLKEGEEPLVSRVRGVRPILGWIEEGKDLSCYEAYDTIVGRAAALMYVKAGLKSVYGKVLSRGAAAELEKAGIAWEAEESPEYIVNRQGTGMCPMEQTVLGIDDPEKAFFALKEKIASLQSARPGI